LGFRALVHPTAILGPRVELDIDVEIGPYCVVGPGVRIAEGTRLLSHVVVQGKTSIGRGNVFHAFSVIGGEAQLRKEADAQSSASALSIGDENVFREHVTVNTSTGERPTTIGSKNLFMAGCHVAHDVELGSCCVVANAVQLAGHAVVEDWVTFGGLSGVAQRVRVGQSAFVAAGAMCERDVPPFVIVQGDRARVRALNVVGLERRGVPAASVLHLRRAYARLFVRSGASFESALASLDRSDPWVELLLAALR
jgi:UDP-N-acetylglucosamine acyltransferase